MFPQFHYIYDDDFNTCHRDSKFKYLWQGRAKPQTILEAKKNIVDVLPTSTSTLSGIELPEADGPLQRFFVPWEIEDPIEENSETPVPNDAAQTPEAPVPPKQLLPPNVIEHNAIITTRSGRRICCPTLFVDAHANSAFSTPSLLTNGTMTKSFASFKTRNALLYLICLISLTNP